MTYFPARSQISAITNATRAVVTFTADHDYSVGEIVSFRVGKPFGMFQINRRRAKVLSTTSDSITIDIDSSTWDDFSLANLDTAGTSPPICVPSSSSSIPNSIIPMTNIADAFDVRR